MVTSLTWISVKYCLDKGVVPFYYISLNIISCYNYIFIDFLLNTMLSSIPSKSQMGVEWPLDMNKQMASQQNLYRPT